MARYIDADVLIAEYDRVHIGPAGGARKLMVDAPTADVVEVVRCKDCRHWSHTCTDPIIEYDYGICLFGQWEWQNEYPSTTSKDFCSYGVKKQRCAKD